MQRLASSLAVLLLVGISGCKPGTTETAQGAPATPAGAAVAAAKPALHPCALLADATVAGVVAGAQPGQRDAGDESYGISACRWTAGDGAVVLQVFEAGPGALTRELRASSLEIVDMKRPDAASLVRLEQFDGIADMAGAYVERSDNKGGIRTSNAVLMVQSGDRMAVLRIPQLAEGDRKQALQALKTLGKDIAKGL